MGRVKTNEQAGRDGTTQQRVPVPGISDGQLVLLRLRGRGPPGGHRRAVAAAPVRHADPLPHPVRVRRRQGLHRGPHALPGQLQPVQRRHRRDHVRGIRALFPARLHQARRYQAFQQRVQHHLLQRRLRHLAPEFRQHRVIEPRIIQRQPQQVLPVQPGPHRLGRQPVSQLLRPLQDAHQRQPRRSPARPAPDPERDREVLIGQPLAQQVPDLHRQRPIRLPGTVHGLNRCGDLRIRLRPGGRLHTHDIPILRPGRGEGTTAERIMAMRTARIEHLARPVANKPPVSGGLGDAVWRENLRVLARRSGLGFAAARVARSACRIPAVPVAAWLPGWAWPSADVDDPWRV